MYCVNTPETLRRCASDRVGVHVYNIQLFYSMKKHRRKGGPLQPTTSSQCKNLRLKAVEDEMSCLEYLENCLD